MLADPALGNKVKMKFLLKKKKAKEQIFQKRISAVKVESISTIHEA